MRNSKFKLFYALGLLLVFLNYMHAESGVVQGKIPQTINDFIKEGKQENAIALIDQMIKKKKLLYSKLQNQMFQTTLHSMMILQN